MDAHRVLKEVFFQFGVKDITQYANYIYISTGLIILLSYLISFKRKEEYSLINLSGLKRKVKDLEALTSQLSSSIENLEEKYEINNRQTTLRLDLQSEEQKQIREISNNLTKSIEQIIQNFYESDE